MKIELNDEDVLELKLLKRNLEDKLTSERFRVAHSVQKPSMIRTTDEERELEHGTEVLGRILNQVQK
jgi:hypothetical protein